jgi:hypothetical protein
VIAIPAVTIAPSAVVHRILDALFEAPDLIFDVSGFIWIKSAASRAVQPIFDIVGFVAKAVGASIADPVAAVEALDLPLDIVDPHLKRADLTEAIAIAVRLRRWIILRGRGACHSKSRSGGN